MTWDRPLFTTFYLLLKCFILFEGGRGWVSTTHSDRTMNITCARLTMFDWQQLCCKNWLKSPPTVLPGGRSLARWAERLHCSLIGHLDLQDHHCVAVIAWLTLHISARLFAVHCNRHWVTTVWPFTTERGVTVCPSLDWLTNSPLLGVLPIFKTSLKWRVYKTHSNLLQTMLEVTR